MNLRKEKPLINFAHASSHFCALLESIPADKDVWIKEMLSALATLYATAHQIPEYELPDGMVEIPDSFEPTSEELKNIRYRVSEIFGDRVAYWTYFDPTITNDPTEKPVAGALWDDFQDIYRDITPGLKAWESNQDEYLHDIAWSWRFELGSHWGRHAVDAMRALHSLAF